MHAFVSRQPIPKRQRFTLARFTRLNWTAYVKCQRTRFIFVIFFLIRHYIFDVLWSVCLKPPWWSLIVFSSWPKKRQIKNVGVFFLFFFFNHCSFCHNLMRDVACKLKIKWLFLKCVDRIILKIVILNDNGMWKKVLDFVLWLFKQTLNDEQIFLWQRAKQMRRNLDLATLMQNFKRQRRFIYFYTIADFVV